MSEQKSKILTIFMIHLYPCILYIYIYYNSAPKENMALQVNIIYQDVRLVGFADSFDLY